MPFFRLTSAFLKIRTSSRKLPIRSNVLVASFTTSIGTSSNVTTNPVLSALEAAVSSGRLISDSGAQKDAATALDAAYVRASRFALKRRNFRLPPSPSASSEIKSESASTSPPTESLLDPPPDVLAQGSVPKGLFLFGGVGTGKSLLMDTLFGAVSSINATAVSLGEKEPLPARRVHFHAFMLEVHSRVHATKQQQLVKYGRSRNVDMRPERDAIVLVAKEIAQEAWLLCFDEFQVTDIADAMILQRLFGTLVSHGVMVIATSNRPPEDLYKDGLNRDLFLPFVGLLKTHCKVHELISTVDYRYSTKIEKKGGVNDKVNSGSSRRSVGNALSGHGISGIISSDNNASMKQRTSEKRFLFPFDKLPTKAALLTALLEHGLDKRFDIKTSPPVSSDSLSSILESLPRTKISLMMGRELAIRTLSSSTAVASFSELCSKPVGSADYQGLCSNFKTIFLLDVPRLSPLLHNDARRLITLVDMLYEHRNHLFVTAASPLSRLFDPLLRLQRTGARDLTTILTSPPEPGTKFNDISTSKEEGEKIEAINDDEGDDNSRFEVEVEEGESDGRLTRQLPIAEGSCRFEVSNNSNSSGGTVPGGNQNQTAVVSVVTSAAERAALGELTFACRRAQSRLYELTSI